MQLLRQLVLCPRTMKGTIKMRTENNNTNFEVTNVIATLPQMKTIKEMAQITGLSYYYLRGLCVNNEIVHIRAGNKYLINYDRFCDYLNGKSI